MKTLPQLHRSISRAIERGKGMHFGPEELGLLVTSGAYEVLTAAAAAEQMEISKQRMEARRAAVGKDGPEVGSLSAEASAASRRRLMDTIAEAQARRRIQKAVPKDATEQLERARRLTNPEPAATGRGKKPPG